MQLPDFNKARVLIVGDVMLDRYWYGDTSRISPEAPVPVVHVQEIEERPGGAGNVALNLSQLGVDVSLIGYIGTDSVGDSLLDKLNHKNIHTHLQRVPELPTVTKLRILSVHQQLLRLDFEEGFQHINVNALLDEYKKVLNQVDVVILSDYGKGTLQNPKQFITLANDAGVPVLVDPKSDDFSIYSGASLITPNRKEFEKAIGKFTNDEELENHAKRAMEEYQFSSLLVTRGEHGMSLFSQNSAALHLPTHAQEVFDVTGAGDTVIAALAAGLAAGCDMSDAMRIANKAAGIVVAKLGTATADVFELQQAFLQDKLHQNKILSKEEAANLIKLSKAKGECIVMTNGCFDILHAGHINYLKKAKGLGDRLIVAMNDDMSVKRLKGENRPLNNLENRMEVLGALEMVDWVIPFSDDTPQQLIAALLPDILVKGGDYQVSDIAGHKEVLEAGGKVEILPFIEGLSTSKLIEKIRSSES